MLVEPLCAFVKLDGPRLMITVHVISPHVTLLA